MGHSSADVWGYTPRQMSAFLSLADTRKRAEKAETLALQSLANSGDPRAIKDQHRKLTRDF